MTDYSLWEVILNGDSPVPTRIVEGVSQPVAPTTAEQRLARKNELKARGTLLMALPDKHPLKFNSHKDAKTLMEAIEKRFGVDQIHDRLQKLTHTLIWRNKADLEEQNLDDLFNSLKIYETKVKQSSSSSTASQNLAFVSSTSTDSTTDSVSADASVFAACVKLSATSLPNVNSLSNAVIYYFFTSQSTSPQFDNEDLKQIDVDNLEEMDLRWQMAMLTMRARRFLQKTGKNLDANGTSSMGFDMSKVECYNCHGKGHFARECRSPKDQRRPGTAEPQRRTVLVETSTSNALVSQCDGTGSYDAIKQRRSLQTLLLWLFYQTHQAHLLIIRGYHKQYAPMNHSKFPLHKVSVAAPPKSQPVLTTVARTVSVVKIKFSKTRPTLPSHVVSRSQTPYRRPISRLPSSNSRNSPPRVTAAKSSAVSAAQNKTGTWVWRPKCLVLDHDLRTTSASMTLKRFDYNDTRGTFMPPKLDLVFNTAPFPVEIDHLAFNVQLSPTKSEQDLSHTSRPSAPIIEDRVSDSKEESEPKDPHQSVPTSPKSNSSGKRRNRKACFVCKSVDHLIKDCDFHAKKIAKPAQRNYANRGYHKQYAPKPLKHSIPTAVITQSKPVSNTDVRPVSAVLPYIPVTRLRHANQVVSKSKSPIRRKLTRKPSSWTSISPPRVNAVHVPVVSAAQGKQGTWGNPQLALQDKGVIDSGCSRHMIGNMSYLSDFKELNGGYVAFRGNPKGGNITGKGKIKTDKLDFNNVYFVKELKFNLFSVLQMCDKKNSVLFTDTECLVLSSDFKLPDESQATLDESNLWHRRLAHVNFKTLNKLVKGNLVRGFPTKVFENDHTCIACKKGKQHRASCKTKPVSSVDQPIFRLHMDLFGPTFVKSLNKKSYCLVITDDYSRFTLVFLLVSKDETSPILKTFITGLENQFSLTVKVIKSDNETEFKNSDLNQFCGLKGIKREFSVPKTPQRNGVAERKNRTLIEAARTMLADSLLPIPFWAEAVNTACTGPTWLFDIDSLSGTMNYHPVTAGNQTKSGAEDAAFDGKEHDFDVQKPESKVILFSSSSAQSKDQDDKTIKEAKGKIPTVGQNTLNSTNTFSVVGLSNTAVSPTYGDASQFPDDPNMPGLEDIIYSDDEDVVGVEADFNNLEPSIPVSPILTTSIHKDHPISQIIGDLSSTTQTRSMTRVVKDQGGLSQMFGNDFHTCMFACFLSHKEPKRVHQALKDPSWIDAMQEELLQFKMQKVWVLVDLPYGKRAIAQGHTQEEGIDYEEVFALVAKIEAIRLFLAYASFMGFMVKQKEDGIFISQDKYVAEILRKFGLTEGKSASTPIDIEKPLLKDPDGEYVDVHIYRSMIGSLMYLTLSRPDIMFAMCACAHFQVTPKASHLHAVKRIFKYLKGKPHLGLWYPKDSSFDLVAYSDSDYAGASLDIKSTTGGCQFFGCRLISWQCKKQTVVATSSTEAEYVVAASFYAQFWNTVTVKQSTDVTRLQALVDKKKIFTGLARMGYEKPSTKLTFYKAFFSSQWKFLIYTILQSLSANRTSWNEFSSAMASAVICMSTGRKFNFSKYIFDSLVRNIDSSSKFYMYPRFIQRIIQNQLGDLSTHTTKYISPALTQKVFANMKRVGKGFSGVETPLFEGMLVVQENVVEGIADEQVQDDVAVTTAPEDVTAAVEEDIQAQIIPSPTPPTSPPPPQDIPSTSHVPSPPPKPQSPTPTHPQVAQDLKIKMLKTKMKKLERSNKGRMLDELDRDEGIELMGEKEEKKKDIANDDQAEGRHAKIQAEKQAEIYQIDMDDAAKVLIMHEDELIEVQEVVEVVTTGKLITEVVTADSAPISAASIIIPAAEPNIPAVTITAASVKVVAASTRQRRGVVIRDPEEESTAITPAEMVKNNVGFKLDYFKGKSYDDIRPIFEAKFNTNMEFLLKSKEHIEEEENRALESINETPAQKAAKRRRLNQEDKDVEEIKQHLDIVPDEDDYVYTEATPLARKVLVVDYQIIHLNNKPRYKIIRADETHQLYVSFITLLKNFDREDLESLWSIVKERFSTSKPNNFSDKYLLTTLRTIFRRPNGQDNVWKSQRSVHGQAMVKSWKLLTSCDVHIISFTTTQLILLVERRYPLSRFTLEQMLNVVRLQVEEQSEMSLELIRFTRQQLQEGQHD
nr:hypothetical protein [Tanacetum cinerariifolium]